MKKLLVTMLLSSIALMGFGQTIYYWVGGTTPTTSITIAANWNTSLDGSGTSRPSSSGASDILVFDGTNVGGGTAATGTVAVLVNGGITAAQIKFVNNAQVTFVRATTGTSTITIAGEVGDDFVIEAGAALSLISTTGSIRVAMGAANTGLVSGTLTFNTSLQARFDNTTAGTAGSFRFTNGASLHSNITSTSSSYPFGSNSQSSEKWVLFEDGSHVYYNGGYSPMGSPSTYSALDLRPGSTWHHRADNPAAGFGSFFNRKSFGNIIVENNAVLAAEGTIYRMNNLTVSAGASFITHTSGQTALMGNMTVNGSFTSPAGASNEFIFAGNTLQTVSGSGSISAANIIVADNASVLLARSIVADNSVTVNGKLNFATHQLTGAASFVSKGVIPAETGTGNMISGNYFISGNAGILTTARGKRITGAGIPANTGIVAFSLTADTIYLSQPVTATATAVALSVTTTGAVLQSAHANGFAAATGSVALTGAQTYEPLTSYIIDAPTSTPFGITTGTTPTIQPMRFVTINANVTANSGLSVTESVTLNGKLTLRPLDTLHVLAGATINGTFNSSNYIATVYNSGTGAQGLVQYDGITAATVIPTGTTSSYLPVTIFPTTTSSFTLSVFEGITMNGAVNGTPFTALQQQTVVNAVWNINRLSGTGSANIGINWPTALEGSTFTTLPGSDIGLIQNTGTTWSVPLATGDNTANTASANVTSFGAFSAGAVPQVDPFVFNELPVKTYGDPDFTGGATSLNTTQPIVYTSSNAAVATILSGAIHITGAGTTDITASQASDGFYPAASVTRALTVQKAPLIIQADKKTKFEGEVNPPLTVTYTSFVNGETSAVLLTPVIISTTAVTSSAAGTYLITVGGATSNNYTISFVNDTLTVLPRQTQTISFAALPVKNYGNADFAIGATSTNTTIPLTITSSNTAVATIVGNMIHITGAGTTNITVAQAGSVGYFPATSITHTLTVNKVNLTVRVFDSTRNVGESNPVFRMTYTGFVLGETAANLATAPAPATIATVASSPGNYPVTLQGGVSQNYNFIYTNGKLTILPGTGTTALYLSAFLNTSGNLTVRVYSPQPALGDVMVFDMMGRHVAKKNLFMPAGFINTEVFTPTLQSGTYVVVVRGPGVDLKQIIQIIK